MLKEKIPAIGRIVSLLVLIVAIVVIVAAFIRARKHAPPTGIEKGPPVLTGKVTSIIEGYKYFKNDEKTGREKLRLLAAKDIAYEDGRHELEKVDLTAFGQGEGAVEKGKSLRVVADRGFYLRDQSRVTFAGNVKVTSSDGLEVTTETLTYEQQSETASTEAPVQFRHGEISGSSLGATLHAKDRNLILPKNPHVISQSANLDSDPNKSDPNKKDGQPVEIRGDRANYVENGGMVRFESNVNITQGERLGRADVVTGVINPQTKKIERIELRGNSMLKSQEKGKASEAQSRDMDFYFDEAQRIKTAVAYGAARALSLEPDAPREITAERMEIYYKPNEKGSDIQSIVTQGRTVMKLEAVEASANKNDWSDRVIEADAVHANFREDGKNLARAEAAGNAVMTITPKRVTPDAETKKLRAPRFIAEFFDTGNAIKTFVADPNAIAEFEPMQPESKNKDGKTVKRLKKTLSGKKLIANFSQQTQDVADLIVEGDAKFTDSERTATAARGIYTASNSVVAMRGKPQLWDSSSRANANEIDANIETGESELRGHVRTTYFSRESTGGSAPFKNKKGPVTVASDRALVKHNEGAARYIGNARAWQDDDFVRAENIELDKGERVMTAWGAAQSAFYDFEREVEKGRKQIAPIFASSDRIVYTDANRTTHYEGSVKIRQGSDRIDAATADAVVDEEHKLVSLTASKGVVMTQPSRRATGDQVVYTAATDTAILTGNLAMVEDREREAVTKSPKLTLHLRDARIEANDDNNVESGAKRRVKTTHRIQN
ncbi:MAG: LPS export ABC transporter periplasmic protein LptC [Blastocatellales bacterium]